MAAILVLTIMLGPPVAGPAKAADPAPLTDFMQAPPAFKAAENDRPEPRQVRRPAARRLDPSACAELCRLFERMWSLEKRAPEAPVPTS
jgi:hypothetical protein